MWTECFPANITDGILLPDEQHPNLWMTDPTTPKRVIVYAKENGKEPFTEWLYGLRDVIGRKRILLERLSKS